MGRSKDAHDYDGGSVGGKSGRGAGHPDGWQEGGRSDEDRATYDPALAERHAADHAARNQDK